MAQKIILYYKFTEVADPDAVRRWQTVIAAERGLNGRVIVSGHGINATLGGDIEALEDYIEQMENYEQADFSSIEYKWSDGGYEHFPKLSVKTRKELVTLDPEEDFDVFDTGTPLKPEEWHDFMEQHPDVTVLDARNNYESAIGRFKGAVAPDITTFKEIKPHLEKLDKDKPLITYCTGDVRCEYLTAYMKHKGFKEVYHLDGGIVKYGEKFADEGYWDGSCYVFDKRVGITFSDNAKAIAQCSFCEKRTSFYRNCTNGKCNKRMLLCEAHQNIITCSEACADVVNSMNLRQTEAAVAN